MRLHLPGADLLLSGDSGAPQCQSLTAIWGELRSMWGLSAVNYTLIVTQSSVSRRWPGHNDSPPAPEAHLGSESPALGLVPPPASSCRSNRHPMPHVS